MGMHDMYYKYMLSTLKPLVIETVINHNHQQMGILWENMGSTWDIHYRAYGGCSVLILEGVVSSHMVCRVSKRLEIHRAHTHHV